MYKLKAHGSDETVKKNVEEYLEIIDLKKELEMKEHIIRLSTL